MNHSDRCMQQAVKKRSELMKLWLKLWDALDSEAHNSFFVTPQAIKLAKKIHWHVVRVCTYGFTNIETVKPLLNSIRTFKPIAERTEIFEQCEAAIRRFIKQLPPEYASVQAAMALLDAVGESKKAYTYER
jgi:hypothetical protein